MILGGLGVYPPKVSWFRGDFNSISGTFKIVGTDEPNNCTNAPTNRALLCLHFESYWRCQIAVSFYTPTSVWVRVGSNSQWSSWTAK